MTSLVLIHRLCANQPDAAGELALISRRVAIVATHPIHHLVSWFRASALEPGPTPEAFLCHRPTPGEHAAAGFGVEFEWDRDLLSGYTSRFLRNVAKEPSPSRFDGIDTPEIKDILRNGSYDAVLLSGWHFKAAWQTMWGCWRAGIPVLLRGDSQLNTPRTRLQRTLKWPAYRAFVPKLNACLAGGKLVPRVLPPLRGQVGQNFLRTSRY